MIDCVYTDQPAEQSAQAASDSIKKHLIKGERVLLAISGGSGISIAIKISENLKNVNLSNLFVSLTDERYGTIGHINENWQQLLDAGFNLSNANLYRPLINKDIQQTTKSFNNWLRTQFNKSDYKIGIFGIGTDGHTAGIKPHSSAVKSLDFATSFTGNDFQRITMTFAAIRQFDDVIVQVSGIDKQSIIQDILHTSQTLDNQPAQIFNLIPHATIYTNNKEK